MATLRVIIDNLFAPDPSGVTRYTRELTRALIATAPEDCDVVGVVGSHPRAEVDKLRTELPGIAGIFKLPATSQELALAWNFGIPPRMLPAGLTHSPSMLAPLYRHDRRSEVGNQTVATLHSTALWTAPETLSVAEVAAYRRLFSLAERHLDALVVTNHVNAQIVDRYTKLGDRIHVIPVAPTRSLIARGRVATKAREFGLPDRFFLVFAAEPTANLELLLTAFVRASKPIPLVVVGAQNPGEVPISRLMTQHGLTEDDVLVQGIVSDDLIALMNTRATALISLGTPDMIGLALMDAMAARTPILYGALPNMLDITSGVGMPIALEGTDTVTRLAEAIRTISGEANIARALKQEGTDRVRPFSWEQTAQAVWALHADL